MRAFGYHPVISQDSCGSYGEFTGRYELNAVTTDESLNLLCQGFVIEGR